MSVTEKNRAVHAPAQRLLTKAVKIWQRSQFIRSLNPRNRTWQGCSRLSPNVGERAILRSPPVHIGLVLHAKQISRSGKEGGGGGTSAMYRRGNMGTCHRSGSAVPRSKFARISLVYEENALSILRLKWALRSLMKSTSLASRNLRLLLLSTAFCCLQA